MAREVPITQKSVGITARVQETGGPLGGANLAKHVAGVALQKRDEVQNQVIENTYLKGQTVLSEDITKLEEKYGNNPEALTTALEEYSTSFLDEVSDPNMRARFELQITKGAQTSIARATAKHRARVNEQAKFDNLTALESLKNENYKISSDLLSGDIATQLAAAGQWQEASDRLAQIINATDSQGMPLFSAEYRAKEIAQHVDISLSNAGISYIEKAKDKQQALNEIKSGAKKIPFPDGNGGFEMVDLKEKIGKRAFDAVIRDGKMQVAQAKSDIIAAQEADIFTQIQKQQILQEEILNESIPIDQRVNKITLMDLKGEISNEFATEAKQYLASAKKLHAATNSDLMAGIITQVYDLNATSDLNPKDYLSGVNNIQQQIMARRSAGELSADDEKRLNNQIKTLTSAKISDATQEVSYSFNDARKIIDAALPPEERGDAIRQLFYESQKLEAIAADLDNPEPLTKQQYNTKAQEIVNNMNKRRRERTLETISQINNTLPETDFNDVEKFLQNIGASMADVKETAQKYNMTEKQVIEKLRVHNQ